MYDKTVTQDFSVLARQTALRAQSAIRNAQVRVCTTRQEGRLASMTDWMEEVAAARTEKDK
jgi:hypothetical protein